MSLSLSGASEVLSLFLIPIGGGIPAGVLVAKSRGLVWPITVVLYFISDVILACIFEPLMRGVILLAKRSEFMTRWALAYRASIVRKAERYGGSRRGPFALVMISFGIDPMTGRAAARMAGYGFISGWAIAICGDMIFFALIMISTLCLKSVLGDGTWTAIIIMAAMIGIPAMIDRYRARRKPAITVVSVKGPQT